MMNKKKQVIKKRGGGMAAKKMMMDGDVSPRKWQWDLNLAVWLRRSLS